MRDITGGPVSDLFSLVTSGQKYTNTFLLTRRERRLSFLCDFGSRSFEISVGSRSTAID
jgi:hypothetical protein